MENDEPDIPPPPRLLRGLWEQRTWPLAGMCWGLVFAVGGPRSGWGDRVPFWAWLNAGLLALFVFVGLGVRAAFRGHSGERLPTNLGWLGLTVASGLSAPLLLAFLLPLGLLQLFREREENPEKHDELSQRRRPHRPAPPRLDP